MGYYIDIKTVVWERIHIKTEEEFNAISNKLERITDIMAVLDDNLTEKTILKETRDILHPVNNGRKATIQAFKAETFPPKLLWDNKKQYER